MHNLGQMETVARWPDGLPSGAAEADARICVARAWSAILRGGQLDEMEHWLRMAERAPLPGPFYNFIRSVDSHAAVLRQASARMAGDIASANEAGHRAVLLHPEQTDPGRAFATLGLGITAFFGGELAAAGAALEEALRTLPGEGWSGPKVVGLGTLALVQLEQGQLDEAEGSAYEEARALAREARQVVALCPDPGTLAEFLARTERALQLTTTRRAVPVDDADLSERELAILRLLAGTLSQREIGSELYVSLNTVKSHTRSIFRKLGVSTRAEAVARGRELGYL
jgi:LuxR family maltose regulon positive regulatory protein